MGVVILDMFKNQVLLAVIISWFAAQTIKVVIYKDIRKYVAFGGMPSAHTAVVTCMGWMIGRVEGFDSPIFAMAAVVFAIVVAEVIGIRGAIMKFMKDVNKKLGITHSSRMNHTFSEVLVGFVIGTVVAFLFPLK